MESVEPPRRKGERYSEEEIERGLLEVAMCRGNTRRAARQLAAQGITIPRTTLETWTNRLHPQRYADIQERVLPMIHQRMAEQSEELAQAYAEAEYEALAQLRRRVPDMRASDAASAVRNLATSRGISVDKAALLRGQPTAIEERRDVGEILFALERLGVRVEVAGSPRQVENVDPEALPPGT
jgi:hypothetical protein